MKNKKARALVLMSGGLDSILAVKVLQEQGVEVEIITFVTNFCEPTLARAAAKMLGLSLREEDIKKEFVGVLKNPKHGYGSGLNPCIDCHALMLKKAGEIMRREGFDFVATGEVLGERPMSQHRPALDIVEKDSELKGYLLRPLSAKLLETTIAEKEGLIDREKLLDISGRSRKIQIALAEKYGIKKYPTPAGGCALTQEGFSLRLKELMERKPDFTEKDLDLVGIGRHFFENGVQIILGRNEEENKFLESKIKKGDIFIIPENFFGPEALIRGEKTEETIMRTKDLIVQFSPKAKGKKELLTFIIKNG
jgi:tRNA U34 2-thiouridine synthase MnmA/TrmU